MLSLQCSAVSTDNCEIHRIIWQTMQSISSPMNKRHNVSCELKVFKAHCKKTIVTCTGLINDVKNLSITLMLERKDASVVGQPQLYDIWVTITPWPIGSMCFHGPNVWDSWRGREWVKKQGEQGKLNGRDNHFFMIVCAALPGCILNAAGLHQTQTRGKPWKDIDRDPDLHSCHVNGCSSAKGMNRRHLFLPPWFQRRSQSSLSMLTEN